MPIPRLLHQTCASKHSLPTAVLANVEQLTVCNPDWRHTVYEDAQVLDYIRRHFEPAVFETAKTISPSYGVVLADLFRYLVVYREGGVYLDIKSTVTRPLRLAIHPSDNFLLSKWKNGPGQAFENWGMHPELSQTPGGEFQQWFIAAEAGHPFLKAVIQDTLNHIRHYRPDRFGTGQMGVLRVSGPICYTLGILAVMGGNEPQPAHQFIDIEERGFVYNIWQGHQAETTHYSQQMGDLVTHPAAS